MSVIFVFGSNLAGRHGAGAALTARHFWAVENGVGIGPTGNAFAIPTKDANLKSLPLEVIHGHIIGFLLHAKSHPDDQFLVTAVGCGLAGYTPEQIAPMFKGAPENCFLSPRFML